MEVRGIDDRSDVRELLLAHGRAWRAAYEGILPEAVLDQVVVVDPSDETVELEYDRLTAYGRDRVLVAEDDAGTVRGYAVFRWGGDETRETVGPDESELKELYVDPDWWGKGMGTALLEAGIERLPDDVEAVSLETLAGNEIGIGFYEARGFERVGESAHDIAGESYPTYVYRRTLE